MTIDVQIIPILGDMMNYTYLLRGDNGETAIVDPGDAPPVIAELERQNLKLDFVINTHHHWDHTDGNAELLEKYNAKLVGPAAEESLIGALDIALQDGDRFPFGGEAFETLSTPGHTAGHICLYAPKSNIVFTGDTLFLMGTGRLFEGTAETMWRSLQKLAALPPETKIYCGHEYTQALGQFCLKIEPDNEDLKNRMEHVKELRRAKKPTIPGTIGEEIKTNAFLRAGSAENFAKIRTLKNQS